MNCLALIDVGGGQIMLILALVLIFMGAKRIPEDIKRMREGMDGFRKATRELTEAPDGEHQGSGTGHPFLMALAFILGAVCLILVLNELSK